MYANEPPTPRSNVEVSEADEGMVELDSAEPAVRLYNDHDHGRKHGSAWTVGSLKALNNVFAMKRGI